MISQETIREEINFYEAMQRSLSVKLRGLPKGHIYYKEEHGRKRPYLRTNGREKYLSAKEMSTIRGLMNRAELERSLKMIGENLLLLGDLHKNYHNLEELMPMAYRFPETGLSRNKILRIIARWEKERVRDRLPVELFAKGALEANEPDKDSKPRKFRTSDGSIVKSKSELLIYECLKLKGIPFIYEEPREINGRTLYPDFTIIRESDGMILLWEHFGMMGIEWYRDSAQQKLWDYAAEGFWPLKNLITTFEFNDGDLDATEIDRILKMMGLI